MRKVRCMGERVRKVRCMDEIQKDVVYGRKRYKSRCVWEGERER